MPAAGAVLLVAVVLIVLALVYYLVSTIFALQKITNGLDEVIVSVGEIMEKSAPVNDVVNTSTSNLDAGVGAARGPARQEGRHSRTPSASSTACTPAPPPPDSATSRRAPGSRRRTSPRSTPGAR